MLAYIKYLASLMSSGTMGERGALCKTQFMSV